MVYFNDFLFFTEGMYCYRVETRKNFAKWDVSLLQFRASLYFYKRL